jgi:nifR3 family TIM-barrel protein
MGSEPEQFAAGAVKLVEAGFDVIDINFGCPVKKVLGRCRGGFHLSQPDVALDIIQRTRKSVPSPIPVTVKMRRGIDDTDDSRDHFFKIIEGAFDIGVAAVTVHGRTVKQRYNGPSRWDFLTEVKQRFPDRVILGSGDLFAARDCLDMIAQTGVDGVTVARGCIGNPWIFQQTKALAKTGALPPPPSLFEQRTIITKHFDLAAQLYGEDRTAMVMRKSCIKYSALHPEHSLVRADFTKIKSRDDLQKVLRDWYAEDLDGCYLPRSIHG